MNSFYTYLSSEDSKELFTTNSPDDFRVQLPERLVLTKSWKCGLVDCQLPTSPSTVVYMCCDACDESIVGSFKLPVLNCIKGKTTKVINITYVPLKNHDIENLRIYLRTGKGESVSFKKGVTYCTLRFIQNE